MHTVPAHRAYRAVDNVEKHYARLPSASLARITIIGMIQMDTQATLRKTRVTIGGIAQRAGDAV